MAFYDRRLACLHHHGVPLHRTRHVERPFDAEMFALVVDVMQLVLVVEAAGLLIADERVVLPAVPQCLDGLDMLMRPRVALRMVGLDVAIKVARRVVAG